MNTSRDVALFVENRIAFPDDETHPIFVDAANKFITTEDAENRQQISAEMWAGANVEKDKLFQKMELVRTKLVDQGQRQYKVINLHRCSWEQVMVEVNENVQSSKSLPGARQWLRQCLEKFGDNADIFQSWLQLLPAGDYGASICGVFKLAIGAARTLSKIEDYMLVMVAEIPEIMHDARRYIEIYRDQRDHTLEVRTFKLYLAIIKALQHVMQYFGERSYKHLFGAIGKQSSYKSELTDALDEIRTLAAKVKEEASICFHLRLANFENIINAGHKQLLINMDEKLQNFFLHLLASNPSVREPLYADNHASSRRALGEHNMLSPTTSSSVESRSPSPKPLLRPKKLLKLLKYQPEDILNDLQTCLEFEYLLDEQAKAYAAAAVQHKNFRRWLVEESASRALLINGHNDESGDFESPLSFLCAEIVKMFQHVDSALAIGFFCKCHTGYEGSSTLPNSTGLILSLSGQLLSQMISKGLKPDLSFLDDEDIHRIENHDIDALCFLFGELVLQLPREKILVCALDEVSMYETEDIGTDTDIVMRQLSQLLKRKPNAVVKLLVTCLGQSLDFHQHFEEENIVHLEEHAEADTSGVWNLQGAQENYSYDVDEDLSE